MSSDDDRSPAWVLPAVWVAVAGLAAALLAAAGGVYVLRQRAVRAEAEALAARAEAEATRAEAKVRLAMPPAPPAGMPKPAEPSRPPAWIVKAEEALARHRSGARPSEPVRPRGLTDAEFRQLDLEAESTLASCRGYIENGCGSVEEGRMLLQWLRTGRLGTLYPKTERALIREALRSQARLSKEEIEIWVQQYPVLRSLLDADTREEFGKIPPPADRREQYWRFARAAGLDAPWSLVVPFDALPPDAMPRAVQVAGTVAARSLGAVGEAEWALLLAAGASGFVDAELAKAKRQYGLEEPPSPDNPNPFVRKK